LHELPVSGNVLCQGLTFKPFPVQAFIRPECFDFYREEALAMGFGHVESGPYVRSSYHAEQYHGGDEK
jgi:lipoate synthase